MRVLAADGQPLYRDAVARAIRERPELELVAPGVRRQGGTRSDRHRAARRGADRQDARGLSGKQVLNAVARDGLRTRVVLIAAQPEPCEVYAALADGAAGYLTKDADARELCDAITAVARGKTVLAPELQAGVAGEIRLRAPHDRPVMSDRERETLTLIAEGLSAPQIGRTLHLSTATVKTHLQHIYEKLGVSERAAAVAEAMRRGLLE